MAVTHRPFLLIAMGFSGGILLEKFGLVPLWAWPVALLMVFLVSFIPCCRRTSFIFLLTGVFVCAGAMALRSYVGIPREHISNFIGCEGGADMELKCRVVSEVEHRLLGRQQRVIFTAEAMELTVGSACYKVNGRIRVTIFRGENVEPGDEMSLSGRLHRPVSFGGQSRLSYTDTLLSQKVIAAFNVKKKGSSRIV